MARFARFDGASCCGMHSEGNPSGPFVLGLQGLGLMRIKCAFRLMTVAAAVPLWDRDRFVVGQI